MAHAEHARPPDRFRDDPGGDDDDERLHDLFRALPEAEALSPLELARVATRLGRGAGASRRTRLPQSLLVVAAALAGAGVAAAGIGVVSVWTAPADTRAPLERQPAHSKREATPAAKPMRARLPSNVEPLPEPSAVTSASPPSSLPAPKPSSFAPELDAELARESELLQSALVQLRKRGDARGALALLDRYEREFPRGKLIVEAQVTRVDALLRASERGSALALLDRMPLERTARTDELGVLRAELRAERDCRAALPEFDALVARSLSAALAERSLYGRAACRLQLANEAGGRADLSLYLERYPNGRFAERARARLGTR